MAAPSGAEATKALVTTAIGHGARRHRQRHAGFGNVLANDKGTNLIVTKVNGIDVTGDSVNGQLGYITFEDTQDGDWNYYLFNPANAPSAGSTDVFEYTIADAISGDTDVGLLTIDFNDFVL
jgi:hypothetical protein